MKGWPGAVAFTLASLGLVGAAHVQAQPQPQVQAQVQAPIQVQAEAPSVADVLGAVFELDARVHADARTARTLGMRRSGNAVLIDGDGLLVTIGYLVLEAEQVTLTDRHGRRHPARVLGFDHDSGLGLLQVDSLGPDVRPLGIGEATDARAGMQVLIAGHGGRTGVRPARVTDRRTFAGYWEYLVEEAIYVAPPHPRFAGAALVGPDGRLLGIGSLQVPDAAPGRRAVAGNLFVPIDLLMPVLEDLVAGRVPQPVRPWLGVTFEDHRGHLFVSGLSTDGPGAASGLAVDDIIVAVDGHPVSTMSGFYRDLWSLGAAGVAVPLSVLRNGSLIEITVASASRYEWLRLQN